MATEKVEEVPAAEPATKEASKETVEEQLADLKIDEKAAETPAETPAAEEKTEETFEDSKDTEPEAVPEEAAPATEVVKTVDFQTAAPEATTEPATHENPTEVVHETVEEPHKPTLVEKISSAFTSST